MVRINGGRLQGLRHRGLVDRVHQIGYPLRYVVTPVSLEWYHRGEQI
jgi:hypothetical protein